MRNDELFEKVRIASLRDLDALIGTRVTQESPHTHWEDTRTHFQFSSVEEAIEALHDPYFQQFGPSSSAVFTEVKEFRRYTKDLSAAWDVVESISQQAKSLIMQRDGTRWTASFGAGPTAEASTAPLAICVAALAAKGIVLEFDATCEEPVQVRDYSKS